jgi:hypothetical protein
VTNAEPIRVDLEYPRNDGNPHKVLLGLTDVRAADSLLINFDFDRDGWVIKMDRTKDGGGIQFVVEEEVEVAFVPAWNRDVSSRAPADERYVTEGTK